MPEALYFTEDDAANRLLADDPFALLVGFALDQQVTVQQAFLGPLRLKERLGTLEPEKVAKADLEPLFREKPAIHRFPGSMAGVCETSRRRSPRITTATRRVSGPRPPTARISASASPRCRASAR